MYHRANLPSREISAVELELAPATRTIWELFHVDANQKEEMRFSQYGKNHMDFPIPALEWHTQNKHQCSYQLGTGRSQPCLHGWDALVSSDAFPMLVHGWKKANRLLGCTQSSVDSRSRERSALVRPPPEHCIQLWGPQHKTDMDLLERVQRRDTEMVRGLEPLCYGERLRAGYLKGADKKDEDRLFSRACSNRARGNSFKLTEGRFRLDIRKKCFTMRVVGHWHRLPREAVNTPSLEVFKVRLDGALSN
ncbi:hypothetical protein QYF61_011620 [Mycteria americana]|uniref:Uncharacterized protein n=1 Tax=Mycteria americana TaxID=33587 RepID=A0AAN7NK07_MYCAM|nr:hypothetical protein QYF61_011620 [Mycteria americana]